MKKSKIVATLLVCVLLTGCGEDSKKKEQELLENAYAINLNTATTQMLAGAALSEALCNNASKAWYNAIYDKTNAETIKFMEDADGNGKVDFNDALINLYAYESTVNTVNALKDNKQKVDDLMKDLATPPEKYTTCYGTITELYKTYSSFTSVAIQPTGSYNDYSDNIKKLDSDFSATYDLIKTQLPDIPDDAESK